MARPPFAEELSALVLRALKDDAERFLGETVTEAVITVPPYFSDGQVIGGICRSAAMFALAVIGLYFNAEAGMGVIIIAFVWFRFAPVIAGNYRTELLFPLIALAWVTLSILTAELSLRSP